MYTYTLGYTIHHQAQSTMGTVVPERSNLANLSENMTPVKGFTLTSCVGHGQWRLH